MVLTDPTRLHEGVPLWQRYEALMRNSPKLLVVVLALFYLKLHERTIKAALKQSNRDAETTNELAQERLENRGWSWDERAENLEDLDTSGIEDGVIDMDPEAIQAAAEDDLVLEESL